MAKANVERAKVVGFWRTIELFSPQRVDKVDRERGVFRVEPAKALPWEEGHALRQERLRKGQTRRHTVYLGIYSLEYVFEVLRRVFEPDTESYDDRPGGRRWPGHRGGTGPGDRAW